MPGSHPYSFSKDILGFLMTTESQDLGLTSHPKDVAFYSIVSLSLYWGVRTHIDHRVRTPSWPHWHLLQQGLGTVHIWTSTVLVSVPEIRHPTVPFFSTFYSPCNNKNIYFSEKINPKLSISIFWTKGPYNFLFCFFLMPFFSEAWNIYLFLIKWKWNPFIFGQQTEVYC